ncbi:expressed unknown protein [Seminavis robusta]|uniref:Uncharacterized protein n=1 Tax=Seminavis robusta TaxID=568900 RepID=A0A9N8HLE7_9STRA|nr:expressed unknown protein [Seminavis robusta]|eukprot:Sro804_g204841.1  (188) ;mRNA; f:2107-2670
MIPHSNSIESYPMLWGSIVSIVRISIHFFFLFRWYGIQSIVLTLLLMPPSVHTKLALQSSLAMISVPRSASTSRGSIPFMPTLPDSIDVSIMDDIPTRKRVRLQPRSGTADWDFDAGGCSSVLTALAARRLKFKRTASRPAANKAPARITRPVMSDETETLSLVTPPWSRAVMSSNLGHENLYLPDF